MKKSILQFSVIAAIAASMTLTTSCSSDESVAEAYVPEAVKFGIDLGDMTVARANTRAQEADDATDWTASIDGRLAVGDLVFICMKDADNKFYRKAYKVSSAASSDFGPNTLTENTSGAIGKFYWHEKNEYKQYQVFSFGNSTITDYENTSAGDLSALPSTYTYTVPSDQTDENKKTEFLFGYGTLYNDASSNTKALEASHQLARIDVTLVTEKNKVLVTEDQNGSTLNLDNGTPADPGDDISQFAPTTSEEFSLTIGWNEMMRKGVFTPNTYSIENTGTADHIHSGSSADTETGSWAAPGTGEEKGQITPRVLEKQRYNTSTGKFETQYSAVVMPQEFTGKDLFTIKYDGATYKYTVPNTPVFKIEPGKHYKYKVTLQGTNISVSVAIQEWTEVDKTGDTTVAVLQ